jgi:hypothetical protein
LVHTPVIGKDSKTAVEFDVTEYVKAGKNKIAVEVFRWSDSSWLECQSYWQLPGINRDVFLYALPKEHVEDVKIIATLDKKYKNGNLFLTVKKRRMLLLIFNSTVLKNLQHKKNIYHKPNLNFLNLFTKSKNRNNGVQKNRIFIISKFVAEHKM